LKPFKKMKGKLPGSRRKQDGRSGNEDNRKGGGVDIEESETSRRNSSLHLGVAVGDAVGGGPSREGCDVGRKETIPADDHPPSTPPISHGGKPDSM